MDTTVGLEELFLKVRASEQLGVREQGSCRKRLFQAMGRPYQLFLPRVHEVRNKLPNPGFDSACYTDVGEPLFTVEGVNAGRTDTVLETLDLSVQAENLADELC